MRTICGPGWGSARVRQSGGSGWVRLRSPDGCRPVSPGASGKPVLGKALAEGRIAGRAASLITDAVARVRPTAGMETASEMEAALVFQAVEADQDVLGKVARMWEAAADADGKEPSEAALRAKQGVFYRGRRGGLHYFTLAADDAQYQALATVMNTATNPRLTAENITAGNGTEMARASPPAPPSTGMVRCRRPLRSCPLPCPGQQMRCSRTERRTGSGAVGFAFVCTEAVGRSGGRMRGGFGRRQAASNRRAPRTNHGHHRLQGTSRRADRPGAPGVRQSSLGQDGAETSVRRVDYSGRTGFPG